MRTKLLKLVELAYYFVADLFGILKRLPRAFTLATAEWDYSEKKRKIYLKRLADNVFGDN